MNFHLLDEWILTKFILNVVLGWILSFYACTFYKHFPLINLKINIEYILQVISIHPENIFIVCFWKIWMIKYMGLDFMAYQPL